ncbi:MAG: hypothetical protein LBD68_10600 [Zoogloeaceae bacterium]|jgi:hypothetical protein|nr:hypothetical protein [Zoogloeaceae bacterium]
MKLVDLLLLGAAGLAVYFVAKASGWSFPALKLESMGWWTELLSDDPNTRYFADGAGNELFVTRDGTYYDGHGNLIYQAGDGAALW